MTGIILIFIIFLYLIFKGDLGFYLKQFFNRNKNRNISYLKNAYINLNDDDDEFNPLNMS
jgi:hypothetical protein